MQIAITQTFLEIHPSFQKDTGKVKMCNLSETTREARFFFCLLRATKRA
jgi:hypothetical protein